MSVEIDYDVVELYRDVDTYNSQFNHNTSDKMQLLGLGELPPPASCFICGSGTCDAGYVTFGVWAEFVGNLLICATCLVQASELVGCLAPSVKDLLSRNMTALQSHAKGLEEELHATTEQLNASNTLLNSRLTFVASNGDFNKASSEGTLSGSGESGEPTAPERLEDHDADESTVSEGSVPVTSVTAFDPTASDGLLKA